MLADMVQYGGIRWLTEFNMVADKGNMVVDKGILLTKHRAEVLAAFGLRQG